MMNKPTQNEVDEIIKRHNSRYDLDEHELTEAKINELTADFADMDLSGLSFKGKFLESVEFDGANLQKCDFTSSRCKGALFHGADLRGAILSGVDLSDADMRAVKFDRKTKCRGIRVSNSYGSPKFKRFAEHQDYIEEFRSDKMNLPAYYIWSFTSDCGRSLFRWILLSILLSIGFAFVYWGIGLASFSVQDTLKTNSDELFIFLYYSVVTFTTLGFGDVTPTTTTAAVAVMFEVILGYVMLGGLISIFSNKLVEK